MELAGKVDGAREHRQEKRERTQRRQQGKPLRHGLTSCLTRSSAVRGGRSWVGRSAPELWAAMGGRGRWRARQRFGESELNRRERGPSARCLVHGHLPGQSRRHTLPRHIRNMKSHPHTRTSTLSQAPRWIHREDKGTASRDPTTTPSPFRPATLTAFSPSSFGVFVTAEQLMLREPFCFFLFFCGTS